MEKDKIVESKVVAVDAVAVYYSAAELDNLMEALFGTGTPDPFNDVDGRTMSG